MSSLVIDVTWLTRNISADTAGHSVTRLNDKVQWDKAQDRATKLELSVTGDIDFRYSFPQTRSEPGYVGNCLLGMRIIF